MLNKVLSNLGLQGIKIDTHLHTTQLYPGQNLQGQINFQGASSHKSINGIYLQLMTQAEVESGNHEHLQDLCIAQWQISHAFQLQANQIHQLPFNIQLPLETPITQLQCSNNHTRIWLHTHLDVDWGLDATDRDYLYIHPTPIMQSVIQAMQQLGFQLSSADVERGQINAGYFRSSLGCYQELEFRPQQWGSTIKEIEISFITELNQTHILFEVDRAFRGDGYRTLSVAHQPIHPQQLLSEIQHILH